MEKTFTKYNDNFELVKSDGLTAIYRRGTISPSWEVVRFYKDKDGVLHYPGSTTWGTRGWTFRDEGLANEKFEKVVQKAKQSDDNSPEIN